MEIVPAEVAESDLLRELHVVTWEATYRVHAEEPWYRQGLEAHAARDWGAIVRSQSARGGGVLVARCDRGPVGLCEYGPSEDDDGYDVGHIHRLYVHPSQQRAGIGRALLGAAVDRLRHGRAVAATLWVLETDQGARTFYARLGWKPDGVLRAGPPRDVRYGTRLRS